MATDLLPEPGEKGLFEDIDSYPWDSDSEFQGGLAAILGPNGDSSTSQTQDLTLRARLFYYARKKNLPPINFDAYKAHLASKTDLASMAVPPAEGTPPYPVPFADIVALISSGKPIPGIRNIPSTVLTDQATQPAADKRKKPWEKNKTQSLEQSTFEDLSVEAVAQTMPEGFISTNTEGKLSG